MAQVGDKMTEILGSDQYVWTILEIVSPQRRKVERTLYKKYEVVTISERDNEKWAIIGRSVKEGYWIDGDHGTKLVKEL